MNGSVSFQGSQSDNFLLKCYWAFGHESQTWTHVLSFRRYKPLSLINKVRAWLAVGINEIHPLLIVPSQPKDLAEGKGHTAQSRQRNTMSLQIMPSLFYCRRLCPARGHFLRVCVHLSYCVSKNSDKDTKLFFPSSITRDKPADVCINKLHD